MWNQEPWLLVEYKSPVQNVIAYARIACLLIGMAWLRDFLSGKNYRGNDNTAA